jgi:hypothetical protein
VRLGYRFLDNTAGARWKAALSRRTQKRPPGRASLKAKRLGLRRDSAALEAKHLLCPNLRNSVSTHRLRRITIAATFYRCIPAGELIIMEA